MSRDDYSLRFFSSKIPPGRRPLLTVFTAFFIAVILGQCFYWIFGNSAEPIILGMPFGMFTVVAIIVAEYIGLLVMERMLFKNDTEDE